MRGELYWSAAAGMVRTAIEGGTAFEHVHGQRFFHHLAAHPEREAAFQASMADRARREAADVVAVYAFAGMRSSWMSAAAPASCSRRSSARRLPCAASSSTDRRWPSYRGAVPRSARRRGLRPAPRRADRVRSRPERDRGDGRAG